MMRMRRGRVLVATLVGPLLLSGCETSTKVGDFFSTKAADDLLKLAMSLGRANQKQNACVALAQLDHDFPKPAAAIREHAAAEKKRLGC